jgi:transmembrane sensor
LRAFGRVSKNSEIFDFIDAYCHPRILMAAKNGHSLEDDAVEWFVLLRDASATDEDRARFLVWRDADPGHARAFGEIERLWNHLDHVSPQSPGLLGPGREDVSRKMPSHTSPSNAIGGHALSFNSKVTFSSKVTAAALVLCGLLIWAWMPHDFADYRSGIGERRTVLLDDNSEVELGTATAIDVAYSPTHREVRLLEGEAFFTIAKDAARPFIVATPQGEIEVRGTAFNVKITDAVAVAVAEHGVTVRSAGGATASVQQGKMVRFDQKTVSPASNADLDAIQAWRRDQLVFVDTPLETVLTDLRRYRRGRIDLLSAVAGQKRITAVFEKNRIDDALDTIAESLDLRVIRATSLFTALVTN